MGVFQIMGISPQTANLALRLVLSVAMGFAGSVLLADLLLPHLDLHSKIFDGGKKDEDKFVRVVREVESLLPAPSPLASLVTTFNLKLFVGTCKVSGVAAMWISGPGLERAATACFALLFLGVTGMHAYFGDVKIFAGLAMLVLACVKSWVMTAGAGFDTSPRARKRQ